MGGFKVRENTTRPTTSNSNFVSPPPPRKKIVNPNTQNTGGGFNPRPTKEGGGFQTIKGGFVSAAPTVIEKPYELPKSYTSEQKAIINSKASLIFGQALAGTGKSTTAIGYVHARPKETILVLCFNTANAIDARSKYPYVCKNAVVKTVHALAFEKLDERLKHRVAQRWSSLSVRSDMMQIGIRPDMRTAAITHSILVDFFNTDNDSIDPLLHSKTAIDRHRATTSEIQRCSGLAKRLWSAMQAVEPIPGMQAEVNSTNIPHDGYLKIFSLKKERLPYDAIILDEAQDANAIMLHIMKQQFEHGTRLVFLGDTHQSIYDFRGAVNAMDAKKMPVEPAIYPLTQSWRMGPRTASVANLILKDLKGETLRIDAKGVDAPFDENAPRTLLARLNATLIAEAVSRRGVGVSWVGGIDGYRIGMLLDAWHLKIGDLGAIKDHVMKNSFSCYFDFEEASKYDSEMGVIKKLLDEYDSEIPQIVSDLYSNAVTDHDKAEITLSTSHKSKGLEWDYVQVADDFREVYEQTEDWLRGETEDYPEQEINLLYVSFTRAKKALKLNAATYAWLIALNENRPLRTRSWSLPQASNLTTKPANTPTQKAQNMRGNAFANLTAFNPTGG